MNNELVKMELRTEFLTATYEGESGFYICSQDWSIKYSFDICIQLRRYLNVIL